MKLLVETGIQAGTVYRLHDGPNTLGREMSNRICLPDRKVSRRHCVIRRVGQSLFLQDLETRNGTSVNGRVVGRVELAVGDRIRLGNTMLRVVGEDYTPEGAPAEPSRRVSLLASIIAIFGAGRRRRRSSDTRPENRPEATVAVTDPD